jgi:hypothetical protein
MLVIKQIVIKSELWISTATRFCAFVDNSLPAAVSISLSRPVLGFDVSFFQARGPAVRSDLQSNYDPLHDRYFAPMDNSVPACLDSSRLVAGPSRRRRGCLLRRLPRSPPRLAIFKLTGISRPWASRILESDVAFSEVLVLDRNAGFPNRLIYGHGPVFR